jgi:hypothetical protein
MAHAHCMLDAEGYRRAQNMEYINCFTMAKIVSGRTLVIVDTYFAHLFFSLLLFVTVRYCCDDTEGHISEGGPQSFRSEDINKLLLFLQPESHVHVTHVKMAWNLCECGSKPHVLFS